VCTHIFEIHKVLQVLRIGFIIFPDHHVQKISIQAEQQSRQGSRKQSTIYHSRKKRNNCSYKMETDQTHEILYLMFWLIFSVLWGSITLKEVFDFDPSNILFHLSLGWMLSPNLRYGTSAERKRAIFGYWDNTALQAGTAESSRLQKQRSTQSTAHSHSTIKCNLSVKITKSSPWRWPSRVETCRSVLWLMIKLSLCICWWLVFLYNIVHGHGTH
jgi:hypothetical protein